MLHVVQVSNHQRLSKVISWTNSWTYPSIIFLEDWKYHELKTKPIEIRFFYLQEFKKNLTSSIILYRSGMIIQIQDACHVAGVQAVGSRPLAVKDSMHRNETIWFWEAFGMPLCFLEIYIIYIYILLKFVPKLWNLDVGFHIPTNPTVRHTFRCRKHCSDGWIQRGLGHPERFW